MNKKTLVRQSEIFKKEASLLLKQSKILDLLKQYGQIRFTGSYRLDLMLKFKDIRNSRDLEIPSSKIYQAVIKKGITNPREFLKNVCQELD